MAAEERKHRERERIQQERRDVEERERRMKEKKERIQEQVQVSHAIYTHTHTHIHKCVILIQQGWVQFELKAVNAGSDLNLKVRNLKTFEVNSFYFLSLKMN